MIFQNIVLRYAFFAIISTILNLSIQRLVLWFGKSSVMFALALLAGTLVGLLIKYILDKFWIFDDYGFDATNESKKFSLYVLMGVATTAIFWGAEIAFWLLWKTDFMREAGAVLGLTIGYFVKYRLDRRYVFKSGKRTSVK